jgi:hypothetical protein
MDAAVTQRQAAERIDDVTGISRAFCSKGALTIMLIFLDTEFSSLRQKKPKLLSLGLISEDSRDWYGELSDGWSVEDCHPFVVDNVLSLFTGPKMKRASARRSLRAWIKQFEQAVPTSRAIGRWTSSSRWNCWASHHGRSQTRR